MTIGSSAEVKALKFAEDSFVFKWTEEDSRDSISTTNVLTFQSVSEEDLAYYRCEVREAGKVVLTVYRVLYKDESTIQKSKFTLLATGLYFIVFSCMHVLGGIKREKVLSSQTEKRPRLELTPGIIIIIKQFKLWAGKLQTYCIVLCNYVLYTSFRGCTVKVFEKPFPYIPFAYTGAHDTMTLKNLIDKYSMNSDQLDCEIEDRDIIILAGYFDNVEYYLDVLGLAPAERNDVKRKLAVDGTQIAMRDCLSLWRQHNPSTATVRALVKILLSLKKEEIASKVCMYYCLSHN